jgi:single-strand DNA-binding protein
MDKLIVIGNLGRDPEMRYLPSGKPVTNFSVASNRKWTDNEGVLHEETIWVRVSAFGRLAEVCNQYLSKGRQVYVEGRLRPTPGSGLPFVGRCPYPVRFAGCLNRHACATAIRECP